MRMERETKKTERKVKTSTKKITELEQKVICDVSETKKVGSYLYYL